MTSTQISVQTQWQKTRRRTCTKCGQPTGYRATDSRGSAVVCRTCRPAASPAVPPTTEWACMHCGQVSQRKPTKGRRPKLCEQCRKKQDSNPRTTNPCPVCAKPVAVRATYCSIDCFTSVSVVARRLAAATRRAGRSQVVPYIGNPFRSTPKTRPNAIPVSTRRFKSGQCRVCGAWYISLNLDVTCSPTCHSAFLAEARRVAKERRRARKRDAYVADVNRKRVYERDGYRCHLCRKKTLPDKQVPHPRAPTIDHVIPLAAGGTHEPLNCRTACFLCNALKGDRGGGEQLLLIA